MGVRSVRAMRFIPPCSRGSTAVPLPGLCPSALQTWFPGLVVGPDG